MNTSGVGAGRRRPRAVQGLALAGLLFVAIALGSTSPAGATAGPVRAAPAGQAGDLNVALLALLIGLTLAAGVALAHRAQIARARAIRRFRTLLGRADLMSLVQDDRGVGGQRLP